MQDPIDINSKRTAKSKMKRFWKKHSDVILTVVFLGSITTGGVLLTLYSYRTLMKMTTSLPTVTNEGVKSLYQLGGPNSPLKFELTDSLAMAYNRTGDAVSKARKTLGGGVHIKAEPSDMSAWNYVAQMTNDFIAKNGPIPHDAITTHYLTKI